jgi:lysophospholipase L1-like esterase
MNIKTILIISTILNMLFAGMIVHVIKEKGGLSYILNKFNVTTGTKNPPLSNAEAMYKNRTNLFNVMPINEHSIVFVGDSITVGCEWSEFLQTDALNKGIGGDTVTGVINRLDGIVKENPREIYIMIGINDLFNNTPVPQIADNYSILLQKLTNQLPHAKIYVQSVLPIDNDIYGSVYVTNNDNVVLLNGEIEKLSQKYNVNYIDIYKFMIDDNGKLKIGISVDGVHLNGKGYLIWKDAIKNYL